MKERLCILYPLHSAEDDYPRLAGALAEPAEVHIVHTESPDLHWIETSLVTGSREVLAAGAEALKAHRVEVCMWGPVRAGAWQTPGRRGRRSAGGAGLKHVTGVSQRCPRTGAEARFGCF